MIRRSLSRSRTRAGVRAVIVPLSLAGIVGIGVAAPAGALGSARNDACRAFTAPKARVHAAAAAREATVAALVAALQARTDPWSMNAGQISALQSASAGVAALDSKVQSGCYSTVAALRADATPLLTTYRVYWLRVPQTHAIEAADRLAEVRARIGVAAGKLAAHVGSNSTAQTDLAAMNQALAAADAKLGTAPTATGTVAALPTLAPAADMTADVAAMEAARTDLLAARTSLVQARADGLKVIADLGV